ncbi:ABC-F family ATP-binding cassette domain-containing protein [Nonomuraea soli]|uniref:Macrolide transport system ATP-binding/permease protein n=1 Tax=Nonomuraea soli TaxID=1032476 RepID=A0A7W0CJ96_9ACTN|nr:ABC-F family ATP-binding cassette domain-containing protein [Nonomuraea soli]MBA2891947.1 macrolide transport system ATP-binding/permease protein [Nonomuraea soli]
MRTAQLALSSVTKRYDDRVVLDQVSLTVKPGERIGIIGDNGSGKSTLLKLIAGVLSPDNGELTVVAPGGIGYLAQTLDLPAEATVQEAIDLALSDLRTLEAELHTMEDNLDESTLEAYGELIARFEARGGYDADNQVDAALHGLGLPSLDRGRALGSLSGGERSRLALAATLASAPELLLLDEPTNDLDDHAVAWLEQHLRGHRGTVVAITHDRVFLERITSVILEVDLGKVRRYGNGYSGYLAAKAAERAAWTRRHEEWVLEVERHSGLVAANAGRMAAIPRKMSKAGMGGIGAWRARGRSHGAMGRIRQSQARLEALHGDPVAAPPERLRFSASITTSSGTIPGTVAGTVAGATLAGTAGSSRGLGSLDAAGVGPSPALAPGANAAGGLGSLDAAGVGLSPAVARGVTAASGPSPAVASGATADASPSPAVGGLAAALHTPDQPSALDQPWQAIAETMLTQLFPPRAELTGVTVGSRLHLPGGLRIGYGERLLVTGPNGAGKSTLMRVLAGELTPDTGTVHVNGTVGYLRQEETPWNPALTVLQAFASGRAGAPEEHAEALLSLGLFRPGDLRLRVGELSYGQRRRIELARLVTDPVDLLLLDEPTNHLSPALVEELEEALVDYPGALVIVTHDRRMRSRFTGTHVELDAGKIVARRTV